MISITSVVTFARAGSALSIKTVTPFPDVASATAEAARLKASCAAVGVFEAMPFDPTGPRDPGDLVIWFGGVDRGELDAAVSFRRAA